MNTLRRIATTLILAMSVLMTAPSYAAPDYSEANSNPDPRFDVQTAPAYAMVGDFFIARPMGLAATVVGTGLFIVSLPFTVLSNSVGDAAEALVATPARETFVRCLGCSSSASAYNAD